MTDLVGTVLRDRYFLRQLVGSGGMADVYLAWDQLRSAKMAIKVLRRDLALSPRFFQMFAKEAEVLRRLEHPNIVRLYEFERDGDIVFIVMDWVEGSSLRQKILDRKKPFTPDEISPILQPVCSALNYAHQSQIYHCDVKPANILLHVDGRVLLTDFGVARLASDRTGGGTPPYMAPEQFVGGSVDARTDVYALGVTLYEMLSGGQVPFRGDSPNSRGSTVRERIAWEHLNMPLPPLSQFNPVISSAVEEVVATALSKDHAQRYISTMALREAFEYARMEPGRTGSISQTIIQTFFSKSPIPPSSSPIKSEPPAQEPESPIQSPPVASKPPVGTYALPRGPYLMCRSGDLAGQFIPIPNQGLTIGRSSQNQVHLRDRSISRIHATIIRTRRATYIRDENSSVGTYVNGQRVVGTVILHPGDVIQLGYYQVFEYGEKEQRGLKGVLK